MDSKNATTVHRTKRFPVEPMCGILPETTDFIRKAVDKEWLASVLDQHDDAELERQAFNRSLDSSYDISISKEEWSEFLVERLYWRQLDSKLTEIQSTIRCARRNRETELRRQRLLAGDPVEIAEEQERKREEEERMKRKLNLLSELIKNDPKIFRYR